MAQSCSSPSWDEPRAADRAAWFPSPTLMGTPPRRAGSSSTGACAGPWFSGLAPFGLNRATLPEASRAVQASAARQIEAVRLRAVAAIQTRHLIRCDHDALRPRGLRRWCMASRRRQSCQAQGRARCCSSAMTPCAWADDASRSAGELSQEHIRMPARTGLKPSRTIASLSTDVVAFVRPTLRSRSIAFDRCPPGRGGPRCAEGRSRAYSSKSFSSRIGNSRMRTPVA